MDLLIILPIFAVVSLAVYQIIPFVMQYFDTRFRNTHVKAGKSANKGGGGEKISWYNKLAEKIASRMRQAGFLPERSLLLCRIFICLVIVICLVANICGILSFANSLLLAILMICLANSWLSGKIKLRQKQFKKALYKIYHFLDMQITSGIKVTDAIKGLPEAVRDQEVHASLLRFSAIYELTLNLDAAMEEMSKDFPGNECDILAAHLHQCEKTGQAGRSLRRMEELMFTRYFNILQEETRRLRSFFFWLSLPALGSFLIIMVYPLMYSAAQAWVSVFS